MRVQVGIIGAGPAGLLLAQILHRAGIDTAVLERRSRVHVLGRVRAGVLEPGTVDLLRSAGVGDRLARDALIHDGVGLCFDGRAHRVDFRALVGKSVTLYGQTELTRDLMQARDEAGGMLVDEAEEVRPLDVEGDRPRLRYRKHGVTRELRCDFIAGCDGSHGVSATVIPAADRRVYELLYDFAWLGVLSQTRPVGAEVTYVNHGDGFALCSMRSTRRSRSYIQVPRDTDLGDWSDDRFWTAFRARLPEELAAGLDTGPSLEKSLALLRSRVVEPMRHGRLFLAGDAAHIVPPTGAKGLNLAASDVHYLSRALIAHYRTGSTALLDRYSETALARVWKAVRFSWWLTRLLHRFPQQGAFDRRLQLSELAYLMDSPAARTAMAENYVGLPY